MKRLFAIIALAAVAAGCVTEDGDARNAIVALEAGQDDVAVKWAEDLATDSYYSKTLGLVEAGRVNMLAGRYSQAENWFRKAVDTAVDRKESAPKIKLGDWGNEALAGTITDDRTREYYLQPYEINLALQYGIITQLLNGHRDDAMADARLAVYIQNSLAEEYGEDVATQGTGGDSTARDIYAEQSQALDDLVAATSNSWENPVLWWLTGVMFDQNGEAELAMASYRKAAALCPGNPYAMGRAPDPGKSRLVVIYDQDFVSRRQSLKIPLPIYTAMSIDIPKYGDKPYVPDEVSVSGSDGEKPMSQTLNIQSLAARDLKEKLPGVITRNVTRAATAAAAQAAVNSSGNEYAQIAVLAVNATAMVLRRADTRSWITLPMGEQIWSDSEMQPGEYQIGITVGGATHHERVSLRPGKTTLIYVSRIKSRFKGGSCEL